MQTISFTYNSPEFGTFQNEGPDLTQDEILKLLEESYPEALDIEILEVKEIN